MHKHNHLPARRAICKLARRGLARLSAPWLGALAALAWTAPLAAQEFSVRDLLPAVVVVGAIDAEGRLRGSGSGTIVSPNGTIITNYHVVGDRETGSFVHPERLAAIFMTSRSDEPARFVAVAQVVEGNPQTDLAVLQIVANASFTRIDPAGLNLPSIPLGDSDVVEVGDRITILGFPGQGNREDATDVNNHFFVTLMDGTISGFDRDGAVRSWIRTTAPIMMGNSGGAVIDSNGCLVGVPTRSTWQERNLERMGYLRPINYVPASWLAGSSPRFCRSGSGASSGQPATAARSAGVIFTGQIVDANTGRGISGAVFALLKSTWDPNNPRDEDIAAFGQADATGTFQTQMPAPRGVTFAVLVAAPGYRPLNNQFLVRTDFADHVRFDAPIRLQR